MQTVAEQKGEKETFNLQTTTVLNCSTANLNTQTHTPVRPVAACDQLAHWLNIRGSFAWKNCSDHREQTGALILTRTPL